MYIGGGTGTHVVGWSGSGLVHMDNTTPFPITRLPHLSFSKTCTEKQAHAPLNFSFLLLPFLCTLLSTLSHCFSKSRHKRYFGSKYKYLILKSFRQRHFSKMSFIVPKLMLICAFLVSHKIDKNANPEITRLKKLNNCDFFSNESICFTKALAAKVFNEQLNLFCLSKMNYTKHKSFYKFLLLVSGDISLNPGPTKYPCAICDRGVRKGVFCTNCKMWVHQKCEGISNIEYRRLSKIPEDIFSYTCRKCAVSDVLPFHDVSFEEPVSIRNDSINMSDLNADKDM